MKNFIRLLTLSMVIIAQQMAIYPVASSKNTASVRLMQSKQKLEQLEREHEAIIRKKEIALQTLERNRRAAKRLKRYTTKTNPKEKRHFVSQGNKDVHSTEDLRESDTSTDSATGAEEASLIHEEPSWSSLLGENSAEEIVADHVGSNLINALVSPQATTDASSDFKVRIDAIKKEVELTKALLNLEKNGLTLNKNMASKVKQTFEAERQIHYKRVQEELTEKIVAAQAIQDITTRIATVDKVVAEAEQALEAVDVHALEISLESQKESLTTNLEDKLEDSTSSLNDLEQEVAKAASLSDIAKLELAKKSLLAITKIRMLLCAVKGAAIAIMVTNAFVSFGLMCTGVHIPTAIATIKATVCTILAIVGPSAKLANHYIDHVVPKVAKLTFANAQSKEEFDRYMEKIVSECAKTRKKINDTLSVEKQLRKLEDKVVATSSKVYAKVKGLFTRNA